MDLCIGDCSSSRDWLDWLLGLGTVGLLIVTGLLAAFTARMAAKTSDMAEATRDMAATTEELLKVEEARRKEETSTEVRPLYWNGTNEFPKGLVMRNVGRSVGFEVCAELIRGNGVQSRTVTFPAVQPFSAHGFSIEQAQTSGIDVSDEDRAWQLDGQNRYLARASWTSENGERTIGPWFRILDGRPSQDGA